MIHTNSLQAFKEVHETLTAREMQVYRAIDTLGTATMHQVAKFMGVELNTISGRFGRLRDKKWIEEYGIDNSSGRPRTIWKVKSEPKQLKLI